MNERMARRTLQEHLEECAKHEEKMRVAHKHLSTHLPLTKETFINLDEIQSGFLDQFVYRFSKLQDSLGEKIFPALLLLGRENIKGKTFLDILQRLEELDLLRAEDWIALRELRNEIAYEYSQNVEGVVQALNAIFEKSDMLLKIHAKVLEFVRERYKH